MHEAIGVGCGVWGVRYGVRGVGQVTSCKLQGTS
jgi:hypothetical protein